MIDLMGKKRKKSPEEKKELQKEGAKTLPINSAERDNLARILSVIAIIVSIIALFPSKPHFTLNNPKIHIDPISEKKQSLYIEAEMRNDGQRSANNIFVSYNAIFRDTCGNLIVFKPKGMNIPNSYPPETSDTYISPSFEWEEPIPKNPSYFVFVINYQDDLPFIRWFEKEESRIYWRWDPHKEGFPLVKDLSADEKELLDAAVANPPRKVICNGVELNAS